jgi:hypothetical protein
MWGWRLSGPALRSGLLAMLCLPGAILLAIIVAVLLGQVVRIQPGDSVGPILASAIVLLATTLGGVAWGASVGGLVGGARWPLAVAGGLGYGPSTTLATYLLNEAEVALVERGLGPSLPLHVTFAVLFVVGLAAVAAVTGLALGGALRDRRLALRLAAGGGLAAGLAFLVADIVQDLLGRRVGGPNAAATATMLTVLLVGCLAAALAGGAVMAELLVRHARRGHAGAVVGHAPPDGRAVAPAPTVE